MSGRRSKWQPARAGRTAPAGRRAPRQARWPEPNAPGAHYLTDQAVIARLVRASNVGSADLVLDLGAGYGALTAPLARTGARVIAIERHPRLAERLRRRFAAAPLVTVVEGDLRLIPLPRRPFHVVANPPFALTTLLLRRLLGDPAIQLEGAELVLEWSAARRLAAQQSAALAPVTQRLVARRPPVGEAGRWHARYDIVLAGNVAAASFSPPPATGAAHVTIRPRAHEPRRPPHRG